MENSEDHLAHYGVLGMRWGVRKAVKSGVVSKAFGKKHIKNVKSMNKKVRAQNKAARRQNKAARRARKMMKANVKALVKGMNNIDTDPNQLKDAIKDIEGLTVKDFYKLLEDR